MQPVDVDTFLMKRILGAALSRLRLRVSVKFATSISVLLLAVLTVAGIGGVGLTRTQAQVNRL
ncbi:MAG: hypothetical protein ABJA34_12885, partial [Pseudonocardiales bacterium]